MIATTGGSSRGSEAAETPLSSLHHGAREALARDVELAHHLSVDPDRTLFEQTPRLARRGDPELSLQEGRQVDRIARRQLRLGYLLGCPALADDAGEVLFGSTGGLLPVRAADDEPGELELCLHRIPGRRLRLHHEPVPLRKERVRNPHRLSELFLWRLEQPKIGRAHV